jgi:hypothetical protein
VAWGIDDANHPEVDEVTLERLVLGWPLAVGQRPVGDGEGA